ncbi:MAG: hypothetical protein C0468_00040 [Planctomyces sp.]|nr:hypothetical protein [Planctomyces sp.]
MKSYTFGVAALMVLGAGSMASGQGAGSPAPTGNDVRQWLAGLDGPEVPQASDASEWLWQTESFSQGGAASEFDWGTGDLMSEGFDYGTWTDDEQGVEAWAPESYLRWSRGLEVVFFDLADPRLFAGFGFGRSILIPKTVTADAVAVASPGVIVHKPVLIYDPLIVTNAAYHGPTFVSTSFVHGGAYHFQDVRLRRGFHRGFNRGFHGGFHRGFHGGYYRGFRGGFHGGFHRGFVGPKVFIGPKIFIGPKFHHGFRRIGHAPGVSLSFSSDGFFFGINTFGHHAPHGRAPVHVSPFHAKAHARAKSVAFGHAHAWPWHHPHKDAHAAHPHAGRPDHHSAARLDRSVTTGVSVSVTDSPGAIVNIGRGSASRSGGSITVLEGDQRRGASGGLDGAFGNGRRDSFVQRAAPRVRQPAPSVASAGSRGRDASAAGARADRGPAPSPRVPVADATRVGRDRAAGIPVPASVDRPSRRATPTAQPARGRQAEPTTPTRVGRPERPQAGGPAPIARPARPAPEPTAPAAGPPTNRPRPVASPQGDGRPRPTSRPGPTPRPGPTTRPGPSAGPTTRGPAAGPRALPTADAAPAPAANRKAEAPRVATEAPPASAEAGAAPQGAATPGAEAPSGDQD